MPDTPAQPTKGTAIGPAALDAMCMELGTTKLRLFQTQADLAQEQARSADLERELRALLKTARVVPFKEPAPAEAQEGA